MGRGDVGDRSALAAALAITAGFMLVEVAGSVLSGSLSLISDAAHMLTDSLALTLSLGAVIIADRLPTKGRTFGYHRLEVLAAFINGLLLVLIAAVIIMEAVDRLFSPPPVGGALMGVVGLIGLGANLVVAWMLHGREDLNVRAAFFHVVSDTLSSAAVVVAAAWIALTGQSIVDPLLSIGIAAFILISSSAILRESGGILLQYAPPGVDLDEVVVAIESVEGVSGVHNVHLWSLCSHINILDAHVVVDTDDFAAVEEIKREIKCRLSSFEVNYSTLEFEREPCPSCSVVCTIPAD
ncbi:cation diffusion facilitator family transporter [Methanofollis fontis]|uniref:Cation transporter n=1 Tax=Methanofollis fontis TaxID=2052832 RepID=A0A483CZD6_9EURY|nr:cation diffusion facilitator family transporter [Methanofollis fontis]TAJ45712.1 cation transporter [Methanofollis fontis]